MENGEALLHAAFVTWSASTSKATYTDAPDFAATYATTGRYRNVLASPEVDEAIKRALLPTFERLVSDIIQREGCWRIPTLMGAFVCREPY